MSSWEKNIRKVVPYTPGEQPKRRDIIKLNTNENPYPPAPGVQKILEEYNSEELRLYPDACVSELVDTLAQYYGVESDSVFVGVGSDDVLAMCFLTFFNSDKPVFFPDITYSFYDVWAELFRIEYDMKPLSDDFRIVKEDYMAPNGGIIFPNPNAPTGVLMDVSDIEDIIKANSDSVVIIDEAYIDFGGVSVLPLVSKYDNLLVVRTYSKSRSMAGSRIGFAIGDKKLIKYLNDCKYSFNSYTMDSLTIKLGAASIKDEKYFVDTLDRIIKTREWTKGELKRLGFEFPDSKSNFVFATHKTKSAEEIFEKLKEKGIYVRFFKKPRIDNYLRITIGTDEEMKKLVKELEKLC